MTSDPAEFVAIAHRVVWCTLATVDARGRPRSRVVHPVWQLTTDGPVGRVCTRATPAKRAHLAHSPFASCSYWDPQHDVAVAECAATWDPDPVVSWPVFSTPPPPLGFDPATMFPGGTGDPEAAVIVLRPWRLRWARASDLAAGRPHSVWVPRTAERTTESGTPSGGGAAPLAASRAGTAIPSSTPSHD